jgi:hypothetical protein
MGLTQSTTNVTEPVQTTEKQVVVPQETEVVREAEKVVVPQTVEEPKKDIFERYVEPLGTKIEVQPAEVTDADDVVKKTKKKKSKN